jgi:hypothetical protein
MASVQRKFAACLITLFIISSIGYTGQTTKQTPQGCDDDCNLANQIRACLSSKEIEFDSVSVIKGNIEVVLKANTVTPVYCALIDAIVECAQDAVDYEKGHVLAITIAQSTPSAPVYYLYKGHTGTGTIPDIMPPCVHAAALKVGTLKIKTCKVERKVSEDAKRLGIKIENLDVKVKKCEVDKLCLQVSGKVRPSEISDSRAIGTITALVQKYTGALLKINTDNLKVLPRSGKDSRIK